MNRLFGFLGASLSAVILCSAAHAQCPWSPPPDLYPGGPSPFHVVVSDFDNDGNQDLAMTNNGNSTIGVYLGNGLGAFASQITSPVHPGTSHLVAVDLNDDGNIDIATNSAANDAVSVLYGRGDGTFENVVAYPVGDNPQGVTSADFNADGIPDLAVANVNAGLAVLLGLGGGGFALPVIYSAGSSPYDIKTGDFNEDGIVDLVVTNQAPYPTHGGVSIFIGLGNSGQGNGTFASSVRYEAEANPNSVTSADFDGDDITDLAVANGGSGTILIFKGRGSGGVGDGTFQATHYYGAMYEPRAVIVADLNPDGIKDLVVADYGIGGSGGFIRLLRGLGNGDFLPPASLNSGLRSTDVALGDFNADGLPDIAVPNHLTNQMVVFLGTCGPGPAPEILSFSPTAGAHGATILIYGANFTGTSEVRFNDLGASFVVESDTRIRAQVPAGASSGPISVTNPGGTATSVESFTVVGLSGGINLSWDDCGLAGTSNKNFACDGIDGLPFVAVGSFSSATTLPEFLGATVDIRLESEDENLPDWWSNGTSQCRRGLATNFDFTSSPLSCTDFNAGQAVGGFLYEVGYGGPNRARLSIQYAVPYENRGEVEQGVEYYAFKVQVERTKSIGTGVCSGCEAPVCIRLNAMQLFQPPEFANDPELFDPLNNNVVSWQNPAINCVLTTPVLVSVVTAEATSDRVHLVWQTEDIEHATVHRREGEGEWRQIASLYPDGHQRISYEDTDVTPGASYDYRLGIPAPTGEYYVGDTRVAVPLATTAVLSLARVAWDGSAGALTVSLSLPRAGSASFEVFDVNGRRLGEERLEGLAAGEHELSVRPARPLDPGVFFARVTQDGKGASRRFIVVK